MSGSRAETRAARRVAAALEVRYVHALRLLREAAARVDAAEGARLTTWDDLADDLIREGRRDPDRSESRTEPEEP